jgi:HNH endonuclease
LIPHDHIILSLLHLQQGYQADHIDGNRLNNSAANLQWLSPQENNGRARNATAAPGPKTAKQQDFVFKQPTPQLLSSSQWLQYGEDTSVEVSCCIAFTVQTLAMVSSLHGYSALL